MNNLKCQWSLDKFEAYSHIVLDGMGPYVVVRGEGVCPTTGYAAHLEESGSDADTLRVRIVEDAPGGVASSVLTDTPVTEFRAVSEAKHVEIEGVGTLRVAQRYDD